MQCLFDFYHLDPACGQLCDTWCSTIPTWDPSSQWFVLNARRHPPRRFASSWSRRSQTHHFGIWSHGWAFVPSIGQFTPRTRPRARLSTFNRDLTTSCGSFSFLRPWFPKPKILICLAIDSTMELPLQTNLSFSGGSMKPPTRISHSPRDWKDELGRVKNGEIVIWWDLNPLNPPRNN